MIIKIYVFIVGCVLFCTITQFPHHVFAQNTPTETEICTLACTPINIQKTSNESRGLHYLTLTCKERQDITFIFMRPMEEVLYLHEALIMSKKANQRALIQYQVDGENHKLITILELLDE